MTLIRNILIGGALCTVLGGYAQEGTLDPTGDQIQKWGEGLGLTKPESVVFDEKHNCLYVSNGEKFAVGTTGFISKFSGDGTLEQLKWAEGLSRPTGMALLNGQLWVADVDQLKVIDLSSGKVVKRFVEPIKNSGLNDVTINASGEVFVTASFIHAILKVEADTLVPWMQDQKLLEWANGIFAVDEEVLVGGTHLVAIQSDTKKTRTLKTEPLIQDIDGIWADGNGGYVLSTVAGGSLWHLDEHGKATSIDQGGDYFGDLHFVPETSVLYIPRGNHEAKRYYISRYKLELP
nr:hypothetical protein [Allomuricauda sp.]